MFLMMPLLVFLPAILMLVSHGRLLGDLNHYTYLPLSLISFTSTSSRYLWIRVFFHSTICNLYSCYLYRFLFHLSSRLFCVFFYWFSLALGQFFCHTADLGSFFLFRFCSAFSTLFILIVMLKFSSLINVSVSCGAYHDNLQFRVHLQCNVFIRRIWKAFSRHDSA